MADSSQAELPQKGVQEVEVKVTKTVVQPEAAQVRKRSLLAILGGLLRKKPKVPEGIVTRPTGKFTPMKPEELTELYPGGVPFTQTEAVEPPADIPLKVALERVAVKIRKFFNEQKAAAREGAANAEGEGVLRVSNQVLAKTAEGVFALGERASNLLAGRQTR